MTTSQAANFAVETIRTAKTEMIKNGYVTAELIYATCNKLSNLLNLPFDLVLEFFEAA